MSRSASSCSLGQTVLPPWIDAINPLRLGFGRCNSLMLQRANGRWVQAGRSHARAFTVTTTSGGKSSGPPRA